jgi:Flp pilus assembly protein CpaB
MTSKLFTTRQGTIFLGVIAAVIAAVALIVYLNQYRNSVNNTATIRVLVAKHTIQQGTSGNVISSNELYKWSTISKSNPTAAGALVDPSTLTGQVAVKDIDAGLPLTAADFGPATNSLAEQLNANQRAVVIPLASPQQVGGQITAGSHVDVWVSRTINGRTKVQELLQNIYVLDVANGNVTLRTSPHQSGMVVFSATDQAENAQIWLVLRPTVGSTQATPKTILNLNPATGG